MNRNWDGSSETYELGVTVRVLPGGGRAGYISRFVEGQDGTRLSEEVWQSQRAEHIMFGFISFSFVCGDFVSLTHVGNFDVVN